MDIPRALWVITAANKSASAVPKVVQLCRGQSLHCLSIFPTNDMQEQGAAEAFFPRLQQRVVDVYVLSMQPWSNQQCVLVALDLSHHSGKVFAHAHQVAQQLSLPLEVVFIVDLLQQAHIADEVLLQEAQLLNETILNAKQHMSAIIKHSQVAVSEIHYRIGQRDQQLIQQLKASQVAMLVMGQHHHVDLIGGDGVAHLLDEQEVDLCVVATS